MDGKVLILRTSDENRRSQGGFQWPEQGLVEAPDWDPIPICGNGLHGALWGEGDGTLFDWSDDATWQVVEVDPDLIVDLKGKVKFPWGTVVFSGGREEATDMILRHPGGMGRAVIGAYVVAGDDATARVGYYGSVRVGARGTAFAGDDGEASVGYEGRAYAGSGGKAVAGDRGTATVGSWGTATAGYYGRATAGHCGIAIAGDCGKAQVGVEGAAQAGKEGRITIEWYDYDECQYYLFTRYIGKGGLEPDILYEVDRKGNFFPSSQRM